MKKYLPILVFLMFVVFISAGCDLLDLFKNYDIRGSWNVTFSGGGESLSVLMVFSGTTETGNVLIDYTADEETCSDSGTYSVTQEENVNIIWTTKEPCGEAGHVIMDGKFSDEDTISGTAASSGDPSITINWTATRR